MSARRQVLDQAGAAALREAPPLAPRLAIRRLAGRLPWRPGKPPRVMFVWAFCLATIAAIWLVFAIYAAHERSRIFDLAGRELLGAQNVLRAHARRNYESTRTVLAVIDNWLATNSTDRPGGPRPLADLEALVKTLQSFSEEPLAIRLIDSRNIMFHLGPRDADNSGMDVSDRPYIRILRDALPGTMEMGPTVRRGPITYVMPIVIKAHPNAFDVAYVLAGETIENFSRPYENLLVTADAKLGIVRNDGTILFTWPENPAINGRVVPGFSDILGARPAGQRDLIDLPSIDGSGNRTITGYASTLMAPLVVFASFERRDLDRIWLGNIVIGFLVCLGMSLAVALFAVTVGRMMRRDGVKTLALQDALIQARDADRAKKNFLASMSHELRTPLNAIIGFSDMMRTETFGPLGAPRYKEYAADISDAGRHLLAVIHDILDTARIEHGAIELGNTPINVAATIGQTLALLEAVSGAKSIVVGTDIDPDLPQVRMTKAHLQQVLFNILGNAFKFSPAGEQVLVRARTMEAGIEIQVEDHGIGIPRQRIGELFRPFSKIDDGYVRNAEGIGLGLANSKLIVEAYGGAIRLESEVGRGTRVTFTLADARLLPNPPPSVAPEQQRHAG